MRHNLPTQRKKLVGFPATLTKEHGEQIVQLYQSGITQAELKRRFKHNTETIRRVLDHHDVEIRTGYTKLRPSDNKAICDIYRSTGRSTYDIAKDYNVSFATIRNILKRNNVPRRKAGGDVPAALRNEILTQKICEMYRGGMSQQAIADELGYAQTSIGHVLYRNKIETGLARGSRNARWRGGCHNAGGYIRIQLLPDDPYFEMTDVKGTVLKHRLVMARHLGRPLGKTEQVHHVNGKRNDNRIANLQLQHGQHGIGQRMQCADCGSYNICAVELVTEA